MSFIRADGTLDKHVILSHFISKYEWNSTKLLNNDDLARSLFSRVKLNNDRDRKKYKSNLRYFVEKIKARAEMYTPMQDNAAHDKEHPTEPHLRDAFEILEVDNPLYDGYYLVNRNSYAAAVHEDAAGRKPAYHESPTRSGFLIDAVLEVSAEYSNPYNVYLKLSNDEIGALVITGDFRPNKDSVITAEDYLYREKGFGGNPDKVLNRREALAHQKLLARSKAVQMGNVIRENREKELEINDFKILVVGEAISDKNYNESLKEEYNAIKMWNQLSEDIDDLDDNVDDDVFDNTSKSAYDEFNNFYNNFGW